MLVHGRALTCALMAVLASMAASASAATLTVNTTTDETNAGDRACSLREAVIAVSSPGSANGDCAPAAFGANTIVLGTGRYQLTQFGAGELFVSPTVTRLSITGASESATTIDASVLGDRALEVSAGASVVLRNLTVASAHAHSGGPGSAGAGGATGTAGSAGASGANGGAILNAGSLSLINSAVNGSLAGNGGAGGAGGSGTSGPGGAGADGGRGGSGGAIYNTGALTLQGATLANDHAGDGGKGGAGAQGLATTGNGGAGGASGGGGAVANAGGTVTILASTFRGDSAGAGGDGGAGGSSATAGNGGAGGASSGGGAVANDSGSVSVTNSTFASDVIGAGGGGGAGGAGVGGSGTVGGSGGAGGAGGSGGAILIGTGASAAIESVTLAGGAAGAGGAGGGGGSGSTAGAAGAAGTPGAAGGLTDLGSATTLQNSILASNSGGNCSGSIADQGGNLVFAGGGCPGTFRTGDPNLGPLQDNGGPAWTISLGAGSAALNKVPARGAGCQPTDERGVRRPNGSACDIGAYELAPPTAATGKAGPIGITTATLNGVVTPNAGDSRVQLVYGRNARYGSKSKVQHVGGVVPIPVIAKLTGLKARTTYHYRIVITTSDATVTGVDRTFRTSPAPVITKLTIKPSVFRAGGAPAKITYTDTLPARVTFVVLKRAGKRFVSVGRFRHADKAGANTVLFSGRVGGRKLPRAVYRLQATPRANRLNGKTVSLTFRITG